jgi:hypothetical protein
MAAPLHSNASPFADGIYRIYRINGMKSEGFAFGGGSLRLADKLGTWALPSSLLALSDTLS